MPASVGTVALASYRRCRPAHRIVRTSLDRVTEKMTEAEQELLMLLLEDPAYTYAVLANKLGVSRKTISSRIKSLKDKGIIQRIGSDTKGHWQINNE